MSTVHLAVDSTSGEEVAVKILNTSHADEVKKELFKREVSALKRLRHPNIVSLRHSGWSDPENAFFLVLDYLPYSLDSYLKGEIPPNLGNFEPYRVMREITEALAYAHSEDVIHRDIKPSNILFDAKGRPMLTDFGISKLLTDLTVGQTLAAYWSSGYASPEQREGKTAEPNSDVYSLGAVFFHLLSRQQPLSEGPTPQMVDQYVDGPPPLKNVLKRMLASDPADRPSRGGELLPALEVTRRLETLPRYFLVLTRSAIRDLEAVGYSSPHDSQIAVEAVIEDLGGMDLDEVYLHLDRRGQSDLVILGGSLRLICTPHEQGDALVVKAVQTPYLPHLDIEKGRSMPLRAMWEPVEEGFRSAENSASLQTAVDDLTSLLAELNTYETVGSVKQERQSTRREFIEHWNIALSRNRNHIERQASALEYSAVAESPDYLRFTLVELPSDSLDWEDDTPLAVRASNQSRLLPVGNLVDIRGRIAEVARQNSRFDKDDLAIPKTGFLTINVIEALTANTRQQYAVNAFLYSQMANPNLANVIVDPSNATRSAERTFDFFQDWLAQDKKEAVRRAVSSNELFLIQGPPGTGKTSVITEIILQILHQDPDARILLTSQSNIAVDHALTQIAAAAGGSPPEMVRIGRAEKISSGGENWTLKERARTWRQEVLNNCSLPIEGLRQAEREARVAVKTTDVLLESDTTTAGTIEEWITEAKDLAEQLEIYEMECASLGIGASDTNQSDAAQMVDQARVQLRDQLEALNGLLSQPVDMESTDADDVLTAIIRAAVLPSSTESGMESPAERELHKTQELRRVLNQWTSVVGLTADFQELIAKSSRVVAATCLFSANLFGVSQGRGGQSPQAIFDWAIVDEAGRATVPEVLIPIVRSERTILVGDERQLPPMVDDMIRTDSDGASDGVSLETSLFQSLVEQVKESGNEHLASLSTQYRMHPAIGNLISTVFYDGRLENGDRGRSSRRGLDWVPAPVCWVSTSSLPNRTETRTGNSYANATEADLIFQVLDKMEEKVRGRRQKTSVGVISGYSAQVEQLTTRIDPADNSRWRNLQIEIATVDSFQGRECDVVVYSTVRSNQDRTIGFLRDYRRVNVALSRAKEQLVIVGDNFMMENATVGINTNPFASVIEYMRAHGDECKFIPSELVRLL